MYRTFDLEPETMRVFQFDADQYLKSQPNYKRHCRTMVEMIDCAVSFVGPGIEGFQGEIEGLGDRHRSMGVKERYFGILLQAVIATLKKHLGDSFTAQDEKSWQTVFEFIIDTMSTSYNK
jgi:hemoglobin-like flavoprotein